MNSIPENPLAAMLTWRNSRLPGSQRNWWIVCLLIPPILTCLQTPAAVAAGIVLAAAWPAAWAARQAALLLSLRQRDCMAELLGSQTRPEEWVDGLARHSLTELGRVWPWLGLFWMYALACLGGPWIACLAPVGLLSQAVAAVWLSYLAQAGAAWSRGEDDVVLRQAMVWTVLTPLLLLGPLGLIFSGLLLRWLAARGMSHFDRWQDFVKQSWDRWRGQGRNNGVDLGFAAWLDNPIVFREARREAKRVPGGLPGLMLWRHGLVLGLLGGFACVTTHVTPVGTWGFLVLLLLLQTLRTAFRSVGALVDEREGKTLEGLMLTELGPTPWMDGWATWSWVPRGLECLASGAVLVVLASRSGLSEGRVALACVLLVVLTKVAAYVGLSVSVRATSRNHAHDLLGLELARLWMAGVAVMLIALVAPAALSWLGLGLAVRLLTHYRNQILVILSPVTEVLPMPELLVGLRQIAPPGSRGRLLARLQSERLVS